MSRAWKELEKKTAETLQGVRINRANDYGVSDVDVVIPYFPWARIDCKYRKRHSHHSLVEEIRSKYCKDGQFPILVTKHHSSKREYVTVDLSLFASLLIQLKLIQEKPNEDEHVSDQGTKDIQEREELDKAKSD